MKLDTMESCSASSSEPILCVSKQVLNGEWIPSRAPILKASVSASDPLVNDLGSKDTRYSQGKEQGFTNAVQQEIFK